MGSAKSNHSPSEALDLIVLFKQAPVKPAHLIILAIGVVIAALGSAKLIAAEQHGNAARDKKSQQKILDQADAHALDSGILARPFHATIVAVIGVVSVTVELAIFVIVLFLVTNQIVQCEAVM